MNLIKKTRLAIDRVPTPMLGIFLLTVTVFLIAGLYQAQLDQHALVADPFAYPVVQSDSEGYAWLAYNLIEHGVYSGDTTPPYSPSSNWPPGYPLLLAVSFFFSGSGLPLIIFQVLLAACTGVLIYAMARRFVPLPYALLPAIIFATDLSIAFYTTTAYTDGLFMCLLTFVVYGLFFSPSEKHTLSRMVLLGAVLGYLILLRTIGQYLLIVIPIFYLGYMYYNKSALRTATLNISLLLITAVLVLTPWLMRNHTITGEYTLGSIGPKMLLQYYVTDFLILETGKNTAADFAQSKTATEVRASVQSELDKRVLERGGSEESYYTELAKEYITANPVGYFKYHLAGTLPYFLAGSYRHYFVGMIGRMKDAAGLPRAPHTNIAHQMTEALHSGNLGTIAITIASLSYVLVEVGWRLLLVGAAVLAVFLSPKRDRMLILIMWCLVLYFAVLTGPSAHTRYRIVTEPLFLTLAVIGFWQMREQLRVWRCRRDSVTKGI